MQKANVVRNTAIVAAAAGAFVLGSQRSFGQVDSLTTLVPKSIAIPADGTTLQTFGYDPMHDRAFTINTVGETQVIRLIENVGGAQTFQDQITQGDWFMFMKNGHDEYLGGRSFPGGFMINPKPVPALGLAAYSFGVIIDQSLNVEVSAGVIDPAISQKVYRYNLQLDTNNDARDEMTSLATLAQIQAAAGFTGTTANILRQGAWSGDGQSIYYNDALSTAGGFGGIWKVPVAGGGPSRLLAATDINTEPAVTSSGGVDSIYFEGGGSTGNTGGIDKITYDGTTVGAREIVLAASDWANFLEVTSGTTNTFAMAADAEGNIYFNDSTGASASRPDRRALYRLDTSGRLSKVVSHAERLATFGGSPNSTPFRMQPRTVSYTNGTATFDVTQIVYAELSSLSLIAGAYVFKPGDFNRDNLVNSDDVNLLKAQITTHATVVLKTDAADLKFDMNGSRTVDWKDVKVFQQFYASLYDGDANMDGQVDITDLGILATNWQASGQSWLGADFTGDDVVDITDLGILATNWQMGVPAGPAGADLQAALAALGLGGATVPEPTGIAGLATLGAGLLMRRRSKSHGD